MKASVAIGAFVVLGLATSAYAHNVERVRRELESQGYDQLEFKRSKPPFWVDACRGTQRLHLHVDYYGKITKEEPTGSCPGSEPTEASPETVAPGRATESENSSISTARQKAGDPAAKKAVEAVAQPKDKPAATTRTECKRYFPSTGMTVTVACE